MASPKTRSRTFQYKQATFTAFDRLDLQGALKEAFAARPQPYKRTQNLPVAKGEEDEQERVCIVWRSLDHRNLTCGVLQRYKPGEKIVATVMSDDADNYSMTQFDLPKPKSPKERLELTKNLLYFGVKGNHLITVAKPSFPVEELEKHLRWLLKLAVTGYEDDSVLFLQDEIPAAYRARGISGVKEIELKTEPEIIPVVRGDEDEQRSPATTIPSAPSSKELMLITDDPIVEAFLKLIRNRSGGKDDAETGLLQEAYRKGDLRAKLTLVAQNTKRGEASPLDVAVRSLRHTNLDWSAKLPHKEPLTAEMTRVTRTLSVKMNAELLLLTSVFDRMADMLENLVKAGDVSPDP